MLKIKKEKTNLITEYTAIKKGGSFFDINVNSTALIDSRGNIAGILFVVRDISMQKEGERQKRSQL